MPHLPVWRRYFRVMPPSMDERIDEELRFHLDERIDALMADGLSGDAARAQAEREFGDVDRVRARLNRIDARIEHDRRRAAWRAGLWQDLQVSWRSALRTPAFSAVVIVTLTLGIGANGVIFSFLSGVLLRPLPYERPEALVAVWLENPALGRARNPLSMPEIVDLRAAATAFSGMEPLQSNVVPTAMIVGDDPVPVQLLQIAPRLFQLLGREPQAGRVFTGPGDGIVISDAFWRRQFGADRAIVGKRVVIGGEPAAIVGVMPRDFVFPYAPLLAGPVTFTASAAVDVWVPLDVARAAAGSRFSRNLSVIARLNEGSSLDLARADLRRAFEQIAQTFPGDTGGWSASLVPLHDQVVGSVRPLLRLLIAGVGAVLLVACVNVASLLLARSATRGREMAVRAALGAGRLRLLRQTLVEGVMFGAAGAAAALSLIGLSAPTLLAFAPAGIPRLESVVIDWRVVTFTGAIALVSGLAVALAPAWATVRPDLRPLLADGTRGTSGGRRRLRGALVTAEVAFALVLTVAAVLLTRSFVTVLRVDPGFDAGQVLTVNLNVPPRHNTPDARRTFYAQLVDRLASIPGITNVGGTTRLPLGGANSATRIAPDGVELAEPAWPEVDLRRAVGAYFDTMRIPIVHGRAFDDRDRPDVPAVAIVNQTLARQLFPGEDALGRSIRLGANAGIPKAIVVGIAGDVRHRSLEASAAPEVYIAASQNPPVAPVMVLRGTGDLAALAVSVRDALRAIDPALATASIRTMSDVRLETVAERRFFTWLMGAFGALALLLAVIGVYGMVTLTVSERRQEIGIRLALGARPARVVRRLLADALCLVVVGAAAGIGLSLALMPLVASQLFGVAPADPLTLVAVPVLMLVAAGCAALLPSLNAVRADPISTLRAG